MNKILLNLIVLISLSGFATSEDYQCTNSDGCDARICEDGELKTITFRKGDMVSTEAGWIVSPDDDWVKIRTKDDKRKEPCDLCLIGIKFIYERSIFAL